MKPGTQSDLIEVVKLTEAAVTKARVAFMAPWIEELGLKIGDVVGIKKDMDYKIEIDGKNYYRVRAEDLLYVEEEVHND
jgi:co-chaperonin GroES (HSP10)